VHNVISSCAQALYALRVSQAHGTDDASLHTIDRSVIIAKLTYASSECLVGVHQCNWSTTTWSIHPTESSKQFRSSQFADLCRVVHSSWREVIWDRYPRQ